MPGFTFLYNLSKDFRQDNLLSIPKPPDYQQAVYLKQASFFLFSAEYKNYPLLSWKENGYLIVFEGLIYSHDIEVLKQQVSLFCNKQNSENGLKHWLHQLDGEFVLLVFHQVDQQLWIWNDIYGRLPVYWSRAADRFVIGRDIQQVRFLAEIDDFDPIGLASTLLFGYVPGEKSLWKQISYLPPGVLLKAHFRPFSVEISKGYQGYTFGSQTDSNPEALLASLSTALHNRIEKVPKLSLSLSGGLDSRLIAGLLKQMDAKLPAYTYIDAAGSAEPDLKAVEQIVAQLHWQKQHHFISLNQSEPEQFLQLMELKQGLNYAGMAFILPFLKHFSHHKMSMLTGDGGDKVLADLRPGLNIKSMDQLLKLLIQQYARLSLKQAAAWSGTTDEALRKYFLSHLEAYDEDPGSAFSQFLLRERGRKWLFEGEDRNRAFCWTTTPFYSQPFTQNALSISMPDKAFGKLFLKLLKLLPGQLEQIVNPNWQLPLEEQQAIQKLYFRQQLKLKFPWLTDFQKHLKTRKPEAMGTVFSITPDKLEKLADRGLKLKQAEIGRIDDLDLRYEILGLAMLL
ncbi:MAG: hypothetical protein KJ578_01205 [Bacteroidetes bacterium]|nr:hypothetical protein [Bacteroidota bacterium]MBU2556378.1 hypothetical protein [Bacteroidota bacterium]